MRFDNMKSTGTQYCGRDVYEMQTSANTFDSGILIRGSKSQLQRIKKALNRPVGQYIVLINDANNAMRPYGPFETYKDAQEYVDRRKQSRARTAPSVHEGNYIIQYLCEVK
jgi:hypothetical protein